MQRSSKFLLLQRNPPHVSLISFFTDCPEQEILEDVHESISKSEAAAASNTGAASDIAAAAGQARPAINEGIAASGGASGRVTGGRHVTTVTASAASQRPLSMGGHHHQYSLIKPSSHPRMASAVDMCHCAPGEAGGGGGQVGANRGNVLRQKAATRLQQPTSVQVRFVKNDEDDDEEEEDEEEDDDDDGQSTKTELEEMEVDNLDSEMTPVTPPGATASYHTSSYMEQRSLKEGATVEGGQGGSVGAGASVRQFGPVGYGSQSSIHSHSRPSIRPLSIYRHNPAFHTQHVSAVGGAPSGGGEEEGGHQGPPPCGAYPYARGPSPTPIPSPFPASGHVGPTYQGATQPITEDVGDRASCLARNTPPKTPRKKKKAVKTISVKAEDIDGYRGCDDLDSILEFIESKPAKDSNGAADKSNSGTMKRSKQNKKAANGAGAQAALGSAGTAAGGAAGQKRSRTPSQSKKTRSNSSRSSSVGQQQQSKSNQATGKSGSKAPENKEKGTNAQAEKEKSVPAEKTSQPASSKTQPQTLYFTDYQSLDPPEDNEPFFTVVRGRGNKELPSGSNSRNGTLKKKGRGGSAATVPQATAYKQQKSPQEIVSPTHNSSSTTISGRGGSSVPAKAVNNVPSPYAYGSSSTRGKFPPMGSQQYHSNNSQQYPVRKPAKTQQDPAQLLPPPPPPPVNHAQEQSTKHGRPSWAVVAAASSSAAASNEAVDQRLPAAQDDSASHHHQQPVIVPHGTAAAPVEVSIICKETTLDSDTLNKSGTDEGSSSAVTSDGDEISAALKTSEPLCAVQNDVSVNLSGAPMCLTDELDSVVSDDAAYHQGKEGESIPQYNSPPSVKRSTGSGKEAQTSMEKVSKDQRGEAACGQAISEPDSALNFSYEEDNNNFKFNYDSILQFIKQEWEIVTMEISNGANDVQSKVVYYKA